MTEQELVQLRHELHRLAEPSQQECKTKALILSVLKDAKTDKIHLFEDSNNLLAEYCFSEDGPTILLRADMDAVAVPETIPLDYASQNQNVAHKCGHDGHTAILLGVAARLAEARAGGKMKGRVLLFFQEAEEIGAGAAKLCKSDLLKTWKIDGVYALHNIPGYPLGAVLCREESFTCSVVSCEIRVNGVTAHAAEPQTGVSPFPALVRLAETVMAWNCTDMENADYQICTIVGLEMGGRNYGVAAGDGVLRLTLRARRDARLKQRMAEIEALLADVTRAEPELHTEVRWLEYFAATNNAGGAVGKVRDAAAQNGLPYVEKCAPFAWGEDFGLLTQQYEGALFGLGAGENTADLHHVNYDFPDAILPAGVKMFCTLLDLNYN